LKARDDPCHDPQISASVFDCSFTWLSFREDLRDDVFCGKSRFARILKEASILLSISISWKRPSVYNFEMLSVTLGLLQVQKAGLDISCLGISVTDALRVKVVEIFESIIKAEIGTSILGSLDGDMRVLLAEVAIKYTSVQFDALLEFFQQNDKHLSNKHVQLLLILPHRTTQILSILEKLAASEEGIDCLNDIVSSSDSNIQALVADVLFDALNCVELSKFSFGLKFVQLSQKLHLAQHLDHSKMFTIAKSK
jgi:hypothetical protein